MKVLCLELELLTPTSIEVVCPRCTLHHLPGATLDHMRLVVLGNVHKPGMPFLFHPYFTCYIHVM